MSTTWGWAPLLSRYIFLVSLFGVIACNDPNDQEPLLLATGEWMPYVGEGIDGEAHGITTEIVSTVLERAGYRPSISILPWPRAEQATRDSDENSEFRGSFPWYKTASRERDYYFSSSLLEVELVLFYNVRKDENTRFRDIERIEQLRGVKALFPGTEETYRFPPLIEGTLEIEARPETEHEAFRRLLDPDDDRAILVPAAAAVGRDIVRNGFPDRLRDLGEITARQLGLDQESDSDRNLRIDLHLIASRRNPHNRALVQEFDEALARFKEEGQMEALIDRARSTESRERIVRLSAPPGAELISARTSMEQNETETVRLPRGTQAIVLRWSAAYLGTAPQDPPYEGHTQVRVLNGPMEGRTLFVEDRFIEIP